MAEPRILVVGAGLIGASHVARLARRGWLAGIVDPSAPARALAEEHAVPWGDDLPAFLSAHVIDGAIIATPNQMHVKNGLACVSAGVPMLVEKPIADTSQDALQLVEAAEAADVAVLIGHHRRHNPVIAAARAAVQSGRLGALTMVDAQFWLLKPDDYFDPDWRRAKGAGPVFINLIHDIDLLRHICGEVAEVMALQSSATRGFEVEDSTAIALRFASGALGTISVTDCAAAPWSWEFTAAENPDYPHIPGPAYKLGGTKASLSVPDMTLWSHPQEQSWKAPMTSEVLKVARADPFERQMSHFGEVIAGETTPLVSGREGLKTLVLLEAIKRAAETGLRQELASD